MLLLLFAEQFIDRNFNKNINPKWRDRSCDGTGKVASEDYYLGKPALSGFHSKGGDKSICPTQFSFVDCCTTCHIILVCAQEAKQHRAEARGSMWTCQKLGTHRPTWNRWAQKLVQGTEPNFVLIGPCLRMQNFHPCPYKGCSLMPTILPRTLLEPGV